MTDPQPEVLTTTTRSETPIADSIGYPAAPVVTDAPADPGDGELAVEPDYEQGDDSAFVTDQHAIWGDETPNPAPPLNESPHEEVDAPITYSPNLTAIEGADGDAAVWAHEFYELIGHTTGKWIDEASLQEWLESFGRQVQTRSYRAALFGIANYAVDPNTAEKNAALAVLAFRSKLADGFRTAAGLA